MFMLMRYATVCTVSRVLINHILRQKPLQEYLMKKTVIKTLAVSALVIGLGTSAAFAKTQGRANSYGYPMGPFSDRNCDGPCFDDGMMRGRGGMGMGIANADIIGTVSAVNEEKSVITVKDFDGNETQIHVNPFTRIHERMNPTDDARRNRKGRDLDDEMTVSDVKAGDYVAVQKMNTESKTVEAARIIVAVKEK